MPIHFVWDQAKRDMNLAMHGLDFSDAARVFSGSTLTYVDDRFDYLDERLVTLGPLREIVVSIVHTESQHEIRII